MLGAELAQPDRGGEPGWSRPDDDDVEFHRFAFHVHSSPADLRCEGNPGIFVAPQHRSKASRGTGFDFWRGAA